jgi:hypothetical protein
MTSEQIVKLTHPREIARGRRVDNARTAWKFGYFATLCRYGAYTAFYDNTRRAR